MFGVIWATRQEIQQDYKVSARTMDTLIKEFREQIDKGRYSEYCIQKDVGFVRIDYVAFMHFMHYRKWLKDRHLCKCVEPFNRIEIKKKMQLDESIDSSVLAG